MPRISSSRSSLPYAAKSWPAHPSVIVDAPRGRSLTLLHELRQAMIAPIPNRKASAGDALSWLEELRSFRAKPHHCPTPASSTAAPHAMRQLGGGGLEEASGSRL